MTNSKSRQNSEQQSGGEVYGDTIPGFADEVTASNVTALGLAPAVAAGNAYLGASMAQQRLFFGAVDQQNNGAITALATTTESVHKILGIEP
ncbi:MAG: RebB family R body protein [Candidatus Thiodiazotropha sp.]